MERNERNFEVGDKVRVIEDLDYTGLHKGDVCTIVKARDDYHFVDVKTSAGAIYTGYYPNRFTLVNKGKVASEDSTRYMVHATGCDNKSDLVKTEQELKSKLNTLSNDSQWTGRLIGYKLTPIYEAEKKTVLRCLSETTVKKIKPLVKAKRKPTAKVKVKVKVTRGRPRKLR